MSRTIAVKIKVNAGHSHQIVIENPIARATARMLKDVLTIQINIEVKVGPGGIASKHVQIQSMTF